MSNLHKQILTALFLLAIPAIAAAQQDLWLAPATLGGGIGFDSRSHSWTPSLAGVVPLTPRLFCAKLDGKYEYSGSNNLFNCTFGGLFTCGFTDFGNWVDQAFREAEDGDHCPSSGEKLQYFGGAGLGMQLRFGPRGVASLTSGYIETFEPGRLPHAAAYVGFGLSFDGS